MFVIVKSLALPVGVKCLKPLSPRVMFCNHTRLLRHTDDVIVPYYIKDWQEEEWEPYRTFL